MSSKDLIAYTDFQLSYDELSSLIRLYQPVFSVPALSLYLTLYELGLKQKRITETELCRITQLDVQALNFNRHECERFLLLKTYESDDAISVIVQKPLRRADFIGHPMFGRLFALVCGSEAYKEMSLECAKSPFKASGVEISKPFDAARLTVWNETMESGFSNESKEVFAPHFDVEQFFMWIPEPLFHKSLRTENLKKIVGEVGSLYQISFSDMKSKLFSATNFDALTFDTRKFMYSIEADMKKDIPLETEDPYSLDPVSFLRYIQKHDYVAGADRTLLESLSKNFQLENPVINVLVEYVLETNNSNLGKAYVEKIAATWKRRGVDNVDKALKEIAKPQSSSKQVSPTKGRGKVKSMPVYTEVGSEEDVIDEDIDELRKRIEERMQKGKN